MSRALWAMLLSVPGVATAGPWVQPAGTMRAGLLFIHWQADERFVGVPNVGGKPGDRVPLGADIADAELVHQQLALDLALGVAPGVELTLYAPAIRAEFTDAANGFETVGLGDPIVGINWQVLDPVAFGATLKIPVSEVPRDEQLPISEGQVDLAIWQRTGVGLGRHGWAALDLGYRFRFTREDDLPGARGGTIRRRPGDEFNALLGGGWRPGAAWGVAAPAVTFNIEALLGSDGEERDSEDNALQLPRRQLLELQPGLLMHLGKWWASLAAGVPIWGQEYPAGPRIFAGIGASFPVWAPTD